MDKLINIAIHQIDNQQGTEFEHNNAIINYAEEVDVQRVNNDQTPWCSVFLNWCAQQAGLRGSGKVDILSWLLAGWPTFKPEPGDIVVCWEDHPDSEKGYVGVYMGYSKNGTQIYSVGGKEDGSVSILSHPIEKLTGFQRLVYIKEPRLPEIHLKIGDRGEEVRELQKLLKMEGFECGFTDGVYGKLTAAAVSALKTVSGVAETSGEYNEQARECLMVC